MDPESMDFYILSLHLSTTYWPSDRGSLSLVPFLRSDNDSVFCHSEFVLSAKTPGKLSLVWAGHQRYLLGRSWMVVLNTMQEMNCNAVVSCRKWNNSWCLKILKKTLCMCSQWWRYIFFLQRKAVLGSFNMFCTSHNISPESTWWFINTYVCTVFNFIIC